MVEGPGFYPSLSGRRNLTMFDAAGRGGPRSTRKRRIGEVLERVGLGGIDRRPVQAYSMGMRQRLGLAAALLRRAEAAGARRADERPRPPGHPGDPLAVRRARRPGDHRVPVQPPARRGRDDLHARRDDVGRPTRRPGPCRPPAGADRPGGARHPRPRCGGRGAGAGGRADSRAREPAIGSRSSSTGWRPNVLNRELVGAGVAVRELVVERRTLEDAFLHLTGGSGDARP